VSHTDKKQPHRLRSAAMPALKVDRDAGTILGVPVITAGRTEAPGSGGPPFEVGQTLLAQVRDAINNAAMPGIKSHITHPSLGGEDGIDRLAGHFTNARIVANKVLADFRFGKWAEHGPRGNAREYLLAMAEEAPRDIGVSIDFDPEENRYEPGVVRLLKLHSIDWTSSPAANPAGLLSAKLNAKGIAPMEFNEAQLAKLREWGMEDGTDPLAFYDTLTAEQQDEVDGLGKADPEDGQAATGLSARRGRSGSSGGDTAVAERNRVLEIQGIAGRCNLGTAWANNHIKLGTDIGEVRRVALNSLNRTPGDMPTTTSNITVGSDLNRDTIRDGITDALAIRMNRGKALKDTHPRAASFRGRSLVEMGRSLLLASGVREAETMTSATIAARLMRKGSVMLAQSTSDFPALLGDALGKSLRTMYAEYPQTWQAWCGRRTTSDFKDIKRLALHSLPTPVEIPEGDDYKFVALAESQETYALKTYGTGVKMTRQMLVNDDLAAFDNLAQMAAQACRRLEDDLAYSPITSNQTMTEDSVALFATAHSNIGSGVLSQSTIGTGRVAMATQTDLKSNTLNLRPASLLVPVELEDEARALVAAQELRQTGSTDETYVTNTYSFLRALQVVADPRLSADSAAQWYLTASPEQIDTVELAFLEGEETPVVEEEEDFNSDVRKLKVRHTAASRAIDFRGIYRSSGA